jgi:hypothetical protein
MPFFESKLLNKILTMGILTKVRIPRKLSCEYFISEGVPLKNIILCIFYLAKAK